MGNSFRFSYKGIPILYTLEITSNNPGVRVVAKTPYDIQFINICFVTDTDKLAEDAKDRDTWFNSNMTKEDIVQLASKTTDDIIKDFIKKVNKAEVLDIKKAYRERSQPVYKDPPPLPDGKYQVIYADPPWKYDTALLRKEVESHYPTMDLKEICGWGDKIKNIAADNCVLFMWSTTAKLNWFMDVITAWGFEYKTSMIWDKVKHNMGYYCSQRHEILIIAGKGSATPTITDKKVVQSIDSVQSIEKTAHSKKPDEFYEIIETLYPNTKKIELFARNKRDGWENWGNQV